MYKFLSKLKYALIFRSVQYPQRDEVRLAAQQGVPRFALPEKVIYIC